jgi:tetratricopeptide (TPR) repeat protein
VVEALFTLRSEFRNEKDARDALKHDLEAFEILLQHPIITPEQRTMLEHHQAKMLLRANRKDDAKGIFERLLLADPSFAAARIQLAARVLPGDRAVVECEYLLKQHRIEPEKVSLNIVLEALRVLALHDALGKHQELLTSSVKHASGVDLSMAFRLITSVGQRTWFSSPETVVPMFDAIDSRGFAPAPNDAFEWAQAHKYAAMGLNPDHPKRRSLLSDAIRLFGLAKPTTSEYQRTHHAEALILANAYEQANEQLERVPEDRRGPFWWQRRAQALAGLSRHDEAKVACDKALETLKDTTLRPAFHADRFRIRRAMGDESAVDDLDAAIDQLPAQHRFRVGLQGERAAYLEEKGRKKAGQM